MKLARLLSLMVVAGSLGAVSLVGCSSSDSGNGGASGAGCHVNPGRCHDCGVASCGAKANATFGANWQSLDFAGGACANVLSCQCACGGDFVCAQRCADQASDACIGCQAFEIGPMPPTPSFDGGFDSPGFDSPGFDTTPFDFGPTCRLDGEPCVLPSDCCSGACNASNVCGA